MAQVITFPIRGPLLKGQDHALYLLLKLYRAISREGWEKGPTEHEVRRQVLIFLTDKKLNPFPNEKVDDRMVNVLTDRLLEQFDPVYGWQS